MCFKTYGKPLKKVKMARYKVVCNKANCWIRTYEDLNKAKIAANNHKKRFGHNPIYIYEIEDGYDYVSSQLPAIHETDISKGIINMHVI